MFREGEMNVTKAMTPTRRRPSVHIRSSLLCRRPHLLGQRSTSQKGWYGTGPQDSTPSKDGVTVTSLSAAAPAVDAVESDDNKSDVLDDPDASVTSTASVLVLLLPKMAIRWR